jgi:hypothetical protein
MKAISRFVGEFVHLRCDPGRFLSRQICLDTHKQNSCVDFRI